MRYLILFFGAMFFLASTNTESIVIDQLNDRVDKLESISNYYARFDNSQTRATLIGNGKEI